METTNPPNIPEPVTSQPQSMAPMQMTAGGDKNALNKPVSQDGTRDWSFGLFSCFEDCGTCCMSWWCPCIVYGKNRQRLSHLQAQGVPHPDGGETINSDCLVSCLVGSVGCGWVLNMGARSDIRQRYHIEGSGVGDCCSSYWCLPCDLVQEHREIQLEERSFGGAKA
ncbi:PLAC8-domain-containing protein [Artomyces pyxidatus]|uniref:PLAC8-domain-containing protein n=1 Tax=Artomyces pyxidatus TaxID=48021 RepID=A0ACB8TA33_9AGAM|nr:PLAC8-domain-containing protein [Artomyces pyxidatus]